MSKKKKEQNELEKLQQDMLIREVQEEMQREKMAALWKKYRFAVIGFIAGVLLVTIGNELYHSWREKVSLAESNAFENATILAYTGDPEQAVAILEKLANEGHTGYASLANMKMAGVYFAQNNQAKALAALEKVMHSDAPEGLRAAATLAYVGHTFETENPAKLQDLLKPLLSGKSAFAGSAAELSAALYLKEGNESAAVAVLKEAQKNELTSPLVKERLTELLSVIEK